MEKYDHLIASGCSFTYGYGLDDRGKEAWPAVLASKLDISFVNLGVPAAGNSYISNSIMDYLITNEVKNPLIVIGWSHWARQELCDNRGHIHHMTAGSRSNPKIADILFDEYIYPPYLYKKYLNTILFMQSWARDKKIDCLMFESLNDLHSGEHIAVTVNKALSKMVDRKSFLGFKIENFNDWTNTADRLPDGHPNANAHKQMAEILHEALLNMNNKEQ